MMYVQAAAGLVLLLVGGDMLVRGAVAMAERHGISPLMIGLTVVACGTSMPEMVVCVDAALSGVPSIAIGNVVGSNIANVLLVLGLPALIIPIIGTPDGIRRGGSFMIAGSFVFVAFSWDLVLTRWQGGILLAMLVAMLTYFYVRARREGDERIEGFSHEFEGIQAMPRSTLLSLGFVLAGSVGLVLGADWLVDGAVDVARRIGVSETVIGLTLVAVGTSLPELATSLIAAVRRQGDVAVGNVLGSNIFNIFGVMGVTALVVPVPVPAEIMRFDIWIMLGAAVALGALGLSRIAIGRPLGLAMLVAYGAYLWIQFEGLEGPMQAIG